VIARRAARHGRAALLAAVLVMQFFAACPVDPVLEADVHKPDVRAHIARVSRRLASLGIARDTDALAADLVTWSARWQAVSAVVTAPMRPYWDATLTHQRWALFTTASPDRWRMWIEGRPAESIAWEVLYRPHDPEHRLLAGPLEYRRVRGVWNPGATGVRNPYPGFVRWVARRVFALRPDLQQVRVRMERVHFALPGEPVVQREPWFEAVRVFTRDEVLGPRGEIRVPRGGPLGLGNVEEGE
jgi:hypothetical protein